MKIKTFLKLASLVAVSAFLRFYFIKGPLNTDSLLIQLGVILVTLAIGGIVIYQVANYIEDITTILKDKTGLAGGLLQAFGTAFPDMALGITAAITSLSFAGTNQLLAIQYAIVAASTTFGSNIYNIAHAAWCIYRQNQANETNKTLKMFPLFGGGKVQPLHNHHIKPKVIEINTAISVLVALSVLTTIVVLSMVFFGKITPPAGITGDLYQLKWYIGVIMVALILLTLYIFRKNYGSHQDDETNDFTSAHGIILWLVLIICGVIILFTAESMVEAVVKFSETTHIPAVISGLLVGIIGCLGEMLVIHNYTVNPKGRIGDAVVGVAMDNIVTLLGASVIAIIGGIFLGGSALIAIFIVILCLNAVLIWQVSKLKDHYIGSKVQE
jgi:Ca2+/Na+ antiporter